MSNANGGGELALDPDGPGEGGSDPVEGDDGGSSDVGGEGKLGPGALDEEALLPLCEPISNASGGGEGALDDARPRLDEGALDEVLLSGGGEGALGGGRPYGECGG